MTTNIKQIIFQAYGNPNVLQLVAGTLPAPAPGELLIRVTAIGVNYSDILRRQNRYFMPTPLPFALGSEAVGVVEALGEGVEASFQPGTRVLAILPQAGGYATHVLAAAVFCVPLPPAISDLQATALFVQGSTAQLLVSQMVGQITGKTVLIHAAAGGVGSWLVQLCRLAGAKVIAASSSSAKMKLTDHLGAHLSVDYSQPHWTNQVMDFTGGHGVDVLFEMVGGEVYNKGIRCVADGGLILVYGCASGVQGEIHPEYFVDHHLSQRGFNLAYFIQNQPQLWQQALGEVIQLLAQGQVQVDSPHTFPLAAAAEAHAAIEGRITTGKVVLLP